jgi:hypothetical protein
MPAQAPFRLPRTDCGTVARRACAWRACAWHTLVAALLPRTWSSCPTEGCRVWATKPLQVVCRSSSANMPSRGSSCCACAGSACCAALEASFAAAAAGPASCTPSWTVLEVSSACCCTRAPICWRFWAGGACQAAAGSQPCSTGGGLHARPPPGVRAHPRIRPPVTATQERPAVRARAWWRRRRRGPNPWLAAEAALSVRALQARLGELGALGSTLINTFCYDRHRPGRSA